MEVKIDCRRTVEVDGCCVECGWSKAEGLGAEQRGAVMGGWQLLAFHTLFSHLVLARGTGSKSRSSMGPRRPVHLGSDQPPHKERMRTCLIMNKEFWLGAQ